MQTISYMETADFCQRCHTMEPEVVAHENSPHETVECAECHVGNGLSGLIKSKWDGFQQTVKIITGSYARPIPPAAHGMPPPQETCLNCHDPSRQREDLLITRSRFGEDGENTEQRVALVVRLSGDAAQETSGIHWHVLSKVEFLARDDEGRTIDWIGVEKADGTREEYLDQGLVEISEQAGKTAAELRAAGEPRRMSCYDCHNRVGHEFRPAARSIDDAIDDGVIDESIPFIKKEGLATIADKYDSLVLAYDAINDLSASYHRKYPYLFVERPEAVAGSMAVLAEIYRRTSSPEMQAFADDYPSYLGHTDSSGCFRCHDGGHFKIVDGGLSEEAIPSRCSLCHTFPSVGPRAPDVMLGPPPKTHTEGLWTFDHAKVAPSTDASQTSCSSCHSRTYCTNCHSSGATSVEHDNMLFDHASVIRDAGREACTYCHQRPFCLRCHEAKDIDQ